MKSFKQYTVTFGSVGRMKLAAGLSCVGIALITSAITLLMKDSYQGANDQTNDKFGEIKDGFKASTKHG